MCKIFILLFLLPFSCFAQLTISGKIINQADTKPVANASVFLSNASVGSKTDNDGTFTLRNAKPGKYDLVISIIGFETYNQSVIVDNVDIILPSITIFPKTIGLKEVTIKYHADPEREKYFAWFSDEFLGTSQLAKECKIMNPGIIDFEYDEEKSVLTASSTDFLVIENDALGYRIKYLLTNFSLDKKQGIEKKIYYRGAVLFEQLKGTPAQERHWKNSRQQVYENSPMHFLRSAIGGRIEQEGFRVNRLAIYANPQRPAENLLNEKIRFFKEAIPGNTSQQDSLSFWVKKSKLPKTLQKLVPYPVNKEDIIQTTDQPGQFALGCANDGLYIAYSKTHHFRIKDQVDYLYNRANIENTLISFNSPFAYFYKNGVIVNPYSVIFAGVWGRNRVAELLPMDYEVPHSANAPVNNTAIESVVAKLTAYTEGHIIEKAYLHFDKPYYAAGDTIYFKAYLTFGQEHRLSNLSGVLHVDLINTNNKIDQSIKLQVVNGVTHGDFALPDSLPKGNYQVRAYTQWMRNDGPTGYFNQIIPVGSVNKAAVPENLVKQPVVMVNSKADIQFLPEGGSLVTGIRSKVAFKAIGTNGLGMNVKGVVLNQDNKEIATFASVHLGMGYFYLQPATSDTYKAVVTYANGQKGEAALPKPIASGIVFTVNNEPAFQALVKIEASGAYFRAYKSKNFNLLIYSGGKATTLTCKLDSQAINIALSKKQFQTGIATLTLFSPEGIPLCERQVFVQNDDQLHIAISSDKKAYSKKEKVNIKLNIKTRADSVTGHFSVSVTDESRVPVDQNSETTIFSSLLLTSDLKGYVEQPNYYFSDTSANGRANLDMLMLTQGYSRFEWKLVMDGRYPPLAYQPERSLEIVGTLKNMFGKLLDNGNVTLIPSMGGPIISQNSNKDGEFRFSNLVFNDTTRFVLSAVNAKGKNSTQITYNSNPEPATVANPLLNLKWVSDTVMTTFLENTKHYRDQLLYYGHGKGIILKEVKIKEKKRDDNYKTQSFAGAGNADQIIHRNELTGGGLLSSQLNARLKGVSFLGGFVKTPYLSLSLMSGFGKLRPPPPMLVIVDGMPLIQPVNIDNINLSDVETIEVLKSANASSYGIEGGGGVLIITTRQGKRLDPKDIVSVGVLPIAPVGFYTARQFYTPRYTVTDLKANKRDFRSTIFWGPDLVTDKEGNTSFEFYNADGQGTYRVVIEGIDEDGSLGRQVFKYKVH